MLFLAYLFHTSIFGDVRVAGGWYFSKPTQFSFQYVLMCVSPAAGVFPSRPASPFIASGNVAGVYPSWPVGASPTESFPRSVAPQLAALVAVGARLRTFCWSHLSRNAGCRLRLCTLDSFDSGM